MFVSNSSTLILLAKASVLREFLRRFGVVSIPREVFDESIKSKDSFDCLLIDREINNKAIKVVNVPKKGLQNILDQFRLHEGEAAAYLFFNRKKHKAILTDDLELIKLCKLEGIPFLCAMAIVVVMHEKRFLSKNDALGRLEKLFVEGRYSEQLYEFFKKQVM